MANTLDSRRALCPYYVNTKKVTITCEGAIRGTFARTFFATAEDKAAHVEAYCVDKWRNCPHARNLNRIYDEERFYKK